MSEHVRQPDDEMAVYYINYLDSCSDYVSGLGMQADSLLLATDRMRVAACIRKPDDESIVKLADELAENIVTNLNSASEQNEDGPLDIAQKLALLTGTCISVATAIDKTKSKTIGRNASTANSNRLSARISSLAAYKLVAENYGEVAAFPSIFTSLEVAADIMCQDTRPMHSWLGVKAAMVNGSAREAFGFFKIIESKSQTGELDETLKSENDELFTLSKKMQKYAVKPIVVPALIGNSVLNEWRFESPHTISKELGNASTIKKNLGSTSYRRDVAAISVTDGRYSSSISKVERLETANPNASHIRMVSEMDEAIPHSIGSTVFLNRTGDLETNTGINLRDFLREHDAEEAYENFRTELMAHYFDIITPLITNEIVESEERQISNEAHPIIGMRRINLARRRVIQALGDELADAMDEEVRVAKKETLTKGIVHHPVVGHIREINPHYRASQKARDRCFDAIGYVLAEYGETWVDEHERGNIPQPHAKGHKASFIGGSATRRMIVKQ